MQAVRALCDVSVRVVPFELIICKRSCLQIGIQLAFPSIALAFWMKTIGTLSGTRGGARNYGFLSLAADFVNRDFCPGVNRYVYWLKEPVGWFVIATFVSILVGATLNPLGWTLAAGLSSILLLGLGFPWLVSRTLVCQIHPVHAEVYENDPTELVLKIRNRLPLPVMGLLVEGYLTCGSANPLIGDHASSPDAGLTRIPPFSTATYRLPIRPEYRGLYPAKQPNIACSFPFGIWTARRAIRKVSPITVRPKIMLINGELNFIGRNIADIGYGERPSPHGDFTGVRDFRRGDSLRSIHWVQSARNDRLVVCERGGPQQQVVDLHLCTALCEGSIVERRENLAWRVRMAASLIDLLVSRHLPFRLFIDGVSVPLPEGASSRAHGLNRLAMIPLDSSVEKPNKSACNGSDGILLGLEKSRIVIDATSQSGHPLPAHLVRLTILSSFKFARKSTRPFVGLVDLDNDIRSQLNQYLVEVAHAN